MEKNKIKQILCQVLGISEAELAQNCSFEALGLDSLKFVQAVVRFEEEFDIEFLDSDLLLSNFSDLESVYATLEKYIQKDIPLKKVLVTDCDNVLWQGISGEEDLTLPAHCLAYQTALADLVKQGVLLCLCSKNEQGAIEDAFASLPMRFSFAQVADYRINRQDKATNLQSLAKSLNLSLDSFVFVDDSPYELELVSAFLPEVTVLSAETAPAAFPALFSSDTTGEERTRQYREQKEREKEKLCFTTVEEFNRSLQTEVCCQIADLSQAERIAELSQRTNQFNLSAVHYTKEEILQFFDREDSLVLSLSVSDKYGDMGIVGSAIVRLAPEQAVIEGFFLSCRGFDRGFEEILLEHIREKVGDRPLFGIFCKNQKNQRQANFYSEHGVMLYL